MTVELHNVASPEAGGQRFLVDVRLPLQAAWGKSGIEVECRTHTMRDVGYHHLRARPAAPSDWRAAVPGGSVERSFELGTLLNEPLRAGLYSLRITVRNEAPAQTAPGVTWSGAAESLNELFEVGEADGGPPALSPCEEQPYWIDDEGVAHPRRCEP